MAAPASDVTQAASAIFFQGCCITWVLKRRGLQDTLLLTSLLQTVTVLACCLQELDWLKGHEAKAAAAKGIAGHKMPISVA